MNAVNLIDGIDGLASGLSMIALVVYGIYFIVLGDTALALVAFASLGCLLAFFRYNVRGFHRKQLKIFMGDTGSLVVGTILGACAIKLSQYSGTIDIRLEENENKQKELQESEITYSLTRTTTF